MMRSKAICLLGLALLGPCITGYAERLTFPQALEKMKERNEALTATQDDVEMRGLEQAAARGLRYPRVELEARHLMLNDPIRISVDPVPVSLTVQDDQFNQGQLKASLPLYTGGRIEAAVRASEARVNEAQAEGRKTEEALTTELAERYFGCCLVESNLEVQAFKTRTMEEHAYQARRLMEEGIIARVEYLNAKVALANARQEHQSAARDLAIVREGLANSVVSEEEVYPASPLFVLNDLETREDFQAYVDTGHPVIDLLASKESLAKQAVRAEKGANRPMVYLFGMHELFPNDLTMLDPEWAMGLGMECTLFDGFQSKNKTAAARVQVRKVTHLRQKIERDLKSLVLKRYEEMEKAREQYDTFEATIELAAENMRVRTCAFEEGFASSIDVVDAALSHARALLGRYKAAYDFDLAFFQLLEASGQSTRCMDYLDRAVPVTAPAFEILVSETPAEDGPTEVTE